MTLRLVAYVRYCFWGSKEMKVINPLEALAHRSKNLRQVKQQLRGYSAHAGRQAPHRESMNPRQVEEQLRSYSAHANA
jgi:hypothetical protein